KMAQARERLALISRPPRTLAPGKYRAYLAPSAMEEIAALLCWGGFSGRALATKQSALTKMQGGESLDARVTGRRLRAAAARAARRRRRTGRRTGQSAHRARVRPRRERRERRRDARV